MPRVWSALIATTAGVLVAALAAAPLAAQATTENGPPIEVRRVSSPIDVDGDLSDAAWAETVAVETWYETNPGDNLPASVRNVARLGYDDEFLYAAFEFDDPAPETIRSPLGDRDNVNSTTDYGGVILDSRNDAKTAQMFLANAAGIQYDALTNDAAGEDSAPDFFWESAGRVTARGWQLEMRIPFSSIRYTGSDPEQWGVLLYRNRPRDFRYQYFTSRLPRDRSCFICNVRPMVGMEDLPSGSHWVVAPYATASAVESAVGGPGGPLEGGDDEYDGGADVKWIPNPDTVIDVAINPDFSQIESDVAQISANERFALFQPEKRPFFLEGVDLFSTQLQAVHTRTITSPKWGGRATGGSETTKYTLLVSDDRGGGLVILPGASGSDFAEQDFESLVAIGRVKREFGRSYASFLYSGREIDEGGHNRVFGPDVRWRPNDVNEVAAQFLWSDTVTPDEPELAEEWDGRALEGYAGEVWWNRSDGRWDTFVRYRDLDDEFRADNGFIPQVGYREGLAEGGRTWRPESGPVRRLRLFTYSSYAEDVDGRLLYQEVVPGFGLDALWNSFVRFEFAFDEVRAIENTFERFQIRPTFDVRPGKVLQRVLLQGRWGDEIDFVHDRAGDGVTLQSQLEVRPGDHLQLVANYDRRWLDVDAGGGLSGRLFTAEVARLKAVWMFDARAWLRVIGQWIETERDPRLWAEEVTARDADFSGSAVFAYKLNWQTVLYVGYSDARVLDETDQLEPDERQAFVKISYAFRG